MEVKGARRRMLWGWREIRSSSPRLLITTVVALEVYGVSNLFA